MQPFCPRLFLYRLPSPCTLVTLRKIRRKSNFAQVSIEYRPTYDQLYIYIKQSSWSPVSNTLKLYRPQHDRPVACVIAQQCSSTTSFSLRFHSLKKNLSPNLKYVPSATLFTLLKLRSLKLRTLGSVCTHCTTQTHIPQRLYQQNAIASLLLVFCAPGSLSEYLWFATSRPPRVPLLSRSCSATYIVTKHFR